MKDRRGSLWPISALLIVEGETRHFLANPPGDRRAAMRTARSLLSESPHQLIRSLATRKRSWADTANTSLETGALSLSSLLAPVILAFCLV
jgi:hypothetical protein